MAKSNNKKQKKEKGILLYLFLLIIGMGFLLYPSLSNYYNSFHQSKAISEYIEILAEIDEEEQERIFNDVRMYNKTLITNNTRWKMKDEERKVYNSLLNITETGIMGYIEIPKISVSLPIYHGTSDEVLQVAVGHVEGSSLPVGGIGTHTVLSGHRGLPSAKIFTDLDKIEEGDQFYIRVLNEVLTYEVDQILIVSPNEMDSLQIDPKQDYCTLVTCTPYGVNSHRMLVRGKRVETVNEKAITITAEAFQIEPKIVMPFIAIPLCLLYIIILLLKPSKKKNNLEDEFKI